MFRRYAISLTVAAAVILVDRITKIVAESRLGDHPVSLVGTILQLRLTYNSGAAFGLGQGAPGLFLVVTVVVVAGILFVISRTDRLGLLVALGLIAGGGSGNVIDRLVGGHDGRVVDFIDLHYWPVFNVADSCIVIGVIIVVALSWSRSGSS